jgi:hypothetical protein
MLCHAMPCQFNLIHYCDVTCTWKQVGSNNFYQNVFMKLTQKKAPLSRISSSFLSFLRNSIDVTTTTKKNEKDECFPFFEVKRCRIDEKEFILQANILGGRKLIRNFLFDWISNAFKLYPSTWWKRIYKHNKSNRMSLNERKMKKNQSMFVECSVDVLK